MPQVDIIQLLKQDGGEKFYPVTHVDAVIGLKDASYFDLVPDTQDPTKYSVKLKSEYTGLWAEGWLAAGGVGSGSGGGGGGGLITEVKGIADLGTPIQTESLTETFSAKAIESIYESLSDFGASLSLSLPSSYFKDANGNYFLDANGNRILTSSGSSWLNLLNKSGQILSSVELDILTQETDPTVPAWAKQENPALYIGYSAVQTTAQPQTLFGITYINATNSASSKSRMIWDSANEAWHFYGNLYAEGWVSAGGVGSGSGGGGGSYSAGTGIDITNNVISLKTASTSVLGGVKIDGTTITINNGVISAVGGGGGSSSTLAGLSDVSLSSPTNGQTLVYRSGVWQNETVQGGSTVSWGTSGTDYQYLSVNGTSKKLLTEHQSLSGYVTLSTPQTIDGAKTFSTNPVTIGSTSSLSVHQSSHIDIGPLRIEYDSDSKALHITKADSNDTNTYGLYADGFVSAGGVGQTS